MPAKLAEARIRSVVSEEKGGVPKQDTSTI
jgi:hypothetical protein